MESYFNKFFRFWLTCMRAGTGLGGIRSGPGPPQPNYKKKKLRQKKNQVFFANWSLPKLKAESVPVWEGLGPKVPGGTWALHSLSHFMSAKFQEISIQNLKPSQRLGQESSSNSYQALIRVDFQITWEFNKLITHYISD